MERSTLQDVISTLKGRCVYRDEQTLNSFRFHLPISYQRRKYEVDIFIL